MLLLALSGNYDRQTDRLTAQPTNRPTGSQGISNKIRKGIIRLGISQGTTILAKEEKSLAMRINIIS